MTIVVLERGEPPQAKVYVARCHHCTSKLRFNRSDARTEQDRQETFLSITCPVCHAVVTVTP